MVIRVKTTTHHVNERIPLNNSKLRKHLNQQLTVAQVRAYAVEILSCQDDWALYKYTRNTGIHLLVTSSQMNILNGAQTRSPSELRRDTNVATVSLQSLLSFELYVLLFYPSSLPPPQSCLSLSFLFLEVSLSIWQCQIHYPPVSASQMIGLQA